MKINIEARPADIEAALNWVSGLIGAAVDEKVAALQRQEAANPLLALHQRETFAFEHALARARRYRKSTGRLPKGEEFFRLYSFLIPASRIFAALPRASQEPFAGRFREAVNGSFGARPIAYEVGIAAHLMGQGWDVDFIDYAGTARFDLLARLDAAEIEVECKTTSADTGRKVHRQEANRLAELLLPITQKLAEEPGCHRILITVPDRLGRSQPQHDDIAAITAMAVDRQSEAANHLARAVYSWDGVDPWPDPIEARSEAVAYFEQRFGRENASMLFHGRTGHSVVGIMIASEKSDNVIDAIADEAKKAAKQCSGTRPALIALNLVDDLDRADIEAFLGTDNGMQKITREVLKAETRRHVDTVSFTFPQRRRVDQTGSARLSGHLISLYNPDPLFACPEIRSIFKSGNT